MNAIMSSFTVARSFRTIEEPFSQIAEVCAVQIAVA
jgi:hypothetical protein